MSRTARFKEQHEEMVKNVVKISGFLDAAKIKGHEKMLWHFCRNYLEN